MKNIFAIEDFYFSYPLGDYKIGFSGKLAINEGDCILLQGNSGSGKSTLLLALKGIIPHLINGDIAGKIAYCGNDIANLGEQDLIGIGYLQQNPDHQLICTTIFAELAFGLENLGLSPEEIKQRITTIAAEFAISHLLDRAVTNLSGGEKQKINLIAILLMDPEVLLLDEPTAFLDPDSALEIAQILQKYVHNKTVIIVEHNLHYLQNLVNRVIQINPQGEIVECAVANVAWQQPLNVAPPINYSQNQETILDVKNLTYTYKGANSPLYQELNFTLNRGEIVALHGKNGVGKSTLLKLIAKIIPSHQQIFWQQQDIAHIKDIRYWQQVNLLWQNPELHFIANRVRDEVDGDMALLAQFGLHEQALQSPFNLSEGQKRRLSLAIALRANLQLLLLDEPSFGQDRQNKLILIEQIRKLAANGTSFIITTHDEEFSDAIATRKVTLQGGKLW